MHFSVNHSSLLLICHSLSHTSIVSHTLIRTCPGLLTAINICLATSFEIIIYMRETQYMHIQSLVPTLWTNENHTKCRPKKRKQTETGQRKSVWKCWLKWTVVIHFTDPSNVCHRYTVILNHKHDGAFFHFIQSSKCIAENSIGLS